MVESVLRGVGGGASEDWVVELDDEFLCLGDIRFVLPFFLGGNPVPTVRVKGVYDASNW